MNLKRISALCALMLGLIAIGLVTHAKASADRARRELVALENEWLNAQGDTQVLQRILADDFIHALPLGFVTKQQQIDFLRTHQLPTESFKRHLEDLQVRVYGDTGIVNGIVVATDSSGTTVKKTVFTDVFAYRNGRWQAVNAQENDFKPPNK